MIGDGLGPDAKRLAWKSVSTVRADRYLLQESVFSLSMVLK